MTEEATRKQQGLSVTLERQFLIPKIALAVLAVATNAFLIHALRKLDKLKTISFKFVLSLCISDISLGVVLLIFEPIIYYSMSDLDTILKYSKISGFFIFSFVSLSAILTICIAVDRFIHMKYLLKYRLIMTKFRAMMMIIISTIVSFLFSGKVFFMQGSNSNPAVRLAISVIIGMILFLMTMIYLKAYLAVAAHTAHTQLLNARSGMQPSVTPKNAIAMQPSVTPRSGMQPSFTPTNGMQPSVTPKNATGMQPSVTPRSGMQPSVTPKNAIQPFFTPTNGIQPSFTPKNGMQPSVTPKNATGMQPSVTPKNAIQPSVTPMNGIQPSFTPKNGIQPYVTKIRNPSQEFSRMALFIMCSLAICYTPGMISNFMMYQAFPKVDPNELVLRAFSKCLTYVYSVMNALIVLLCSRSLRNYSKHFFGFSKVDSIGV